MSRLLLERIAVLERELVTLRSQLRDEQDAAFARVVAASVGRHVFTSEDLIQHATVDALLGTALNGATARQVGKRLARLAARDLVRRVSECERGWMWEVTLPVTG